MLRPLSLLPALVAAVALGTAALVGVTPPTPADAAAPRASRAADQEPLGVSIDTLAPSVLPKKGKVRITGEITNNDDQTWTTINVYPFVSDTPMTSAAELAAAAEVDPEQQVGLRISKPGGLPYDTIDELAPGDTVPYSIAVPRSQIGVSAEGVYWFGVHALGQDDAGRDTIADGRARTFMPLVGNTQKTVDTALVLPVRRAIRHESDGSIAEVSGWAHSLDRGGQLSSIVEFGTAAGDRPITWLLDPAVPDAVRALTAGNPARSLDPTVDANGDGDSGSGDESEDPSDGSSDDASASPSPSEGATDLGDVDPAEEEAATAGSAWLERLHSGLEGSEILALPYGDVDVAGAATHSPRTYRTARDRSGTTLSPWGLPMAPAVSSPTGYLSADGLRMIDPDTTAVVTDRMFRGSASTVTRSAGRTMVVASSAAISGGPGPDDRLAPTAIRQRLLSEAAVRLLTSRKPLVVVFPSSFKTSSPTDFWAGLDVPWLHLTTVDSISQRPGRTIDVSQLHYPENQSRLELDAGDFQASTELARSGETLQNLLTLNDQVASAVRDESLTDVSYTSRLRPYAARSSAIQSRAWIQERLQSVHVDAPKAVILSSGSGRFSATLTNDLDQPVTVRLDALAEPPLRVSVPSDPVEIGAGQRTSVLLNASSSAIGIRNVTLLLTDSDGTNLNSYDDLPIRSNRVSNVIWLILGTGIALLFGAILVRLVRRVRTARRA
ncbi:DUF6049 family protein [Nocardioides mangrovi]|uniref:DUF6049 family protein n=1 Tax=Nocardioides mangrovi TaxID=2874580 RepID=A0ABS7UBR5_9ACTN|nr:DUF6049 family protein [Nocardioides mangrovi]MBZ5738171.1 DUF6049 family protein [Nocardioides mangrovi]